MFFRPYLIPIMLTSILSFSAIADRSSAPGHSMNTITLESADDVSTAVAELIAELEQQGFSIPLIINHSAAAASVDLDLAPNQVIFARLPKNLEKRLLRKSETVGLDLPLKFMVFKDIDGTVKLSVNSLGYLIDRHEIPMRDFVLRLTNKLMEQFGAAGRERRGLVSVKSSQSIDDTVQALQNAISVNPDARIPLVLDYRHIRSKRGHRKNRKPFPVLIVFGNPNVGTPLMQTDPRVGIDLPLKFLVWEDKQGQVNITYNDPHFIAGRINLQGQDNRLAAIAKVLNSLALAGAGNDL